MTDSFASFKLKDAVEAIIGLQEDCKQPRVMEVYQALEITLKALQYGVNEGMATRRMYQQIMERQDRIMDRLEILERLCARQGSAAPSNSQVDKRLNEASQ